MTVMSDRYDDLREAGFDHRGALVYLAREYGFDDQTMHRVLSRAGRAPREKRERADSRRSSAPNTPSRRRRPPAAAGYPTN